MTIPIARTKLRPPELRIPYIARPRLVEHLQAGAGRKLTLVIAGAGYGKSTLLAEWAHQRAGFLWYNLDLVDRDPAVFFAHLFAGLEELWPTSGRAGQTALNQPVAPDPQYLALLFISELEKWHSPHPLLLFFDDYHRLDTAPAIDTVLALILNRLPQGVHVIVTSRLPVSFPTARLQAIDQRNELTSADLSFNADEIRQLFPELSTLPVPVQQMIERTTGWVTGLQLIRQALTYQGKANPDASLQETITSLDQVYSYFAEEVFAHQPAALQEFLLQTVILETFSPADSDAIFGRADSAMWLTHLTTHGLFTIRRQRDPDVFSYHHLLIDFLRDRLHREGDPRQVRSWHWQAARYFDERQRWDEAFEQAVQAADEALAVEVVLHAFTFMRLNGRHLTIQHWLDRFSLPGWQEHPRLYYCQGHVWQDQGHYQEAVGAFQQALALAQKRGDLSTLASAWSGLGMVRQRTGDLIGSLHAWQQAVENAESGTPQERFTALNGLALNHVYRGENRKGVALLHQCLQVAGLVGKHVQAVTMNNLNAALLYMGEIAEAQQWGERALALRHELGQSPGIFICLLNLGRLQTLSGELDAARSSMKQAAALVSEQSDSLAYSYYLSNRGDLAAVEGNFAAADEDYRRSIDLKEIRQNASGLVHTWVRLSELRRLQGDLADAVACAQSALELSKGTVGPNEYLPAQTALAVAWLEQGQFDPALELLLQIHETHRTTTENHYELTRSLWHLARVQRAGGGSGHDALAEALALAARWNYQFLLSTLGRQDPALLVEAVAADFQPTFVKQVLLQLGDAIVPALITLLDAPDPAVRRRAVDQLAAIATELVWMPLDRATGDADPLVKASAFAALAQLQQIAPPPLRITTLGRFTLQRGDDLIGNEAWQGNRQAQRLFKYLLTCNGQSVHRDKLMALFWPDAKSLDAARRGLNQAVYVIRQTLEPAVPTRYSRYLQTEGGTYRLLLSSGSWVDDQAFVDAIDQAQQAQRRNDAEAVLTNYQAAVELYKGNYLEEESYQDWALRRHEVLQRQVMTALDALVELRLQRDEPELALAAAEGLLQIDPLREKNYALLLQLYLEQGRPEDALSIYQQYEAVYCVEMECSSSPAMRALYERMLKKF